MDLLFCMYFNTCLICVLIYCSYFNTCILLSMYRPPVPSCPLWTGQGREAGDIICGPQCFRPMWSDSVWIHDRAAGQILDQTEFIERVSLQVSHLACVSQSRIFGSGSFSPAHHTRDQRAWRGSAWLPRIRQFSFRPKCKEKLRVLL